MSRRPDASFLGISPDTYQYNRLTWLAEQFEGYFKRASEQNDVRRLMRAEHARALADERASTFTPRVETFG